MTIRFDRHEKVARYLDPRNDYQEATIRCEIRRDPLTGRSGRVAHVLGFRLQPVDFTAMIEESRAHCPFCPERVFQMTPKFPSDVVPEGRVQRGEAVVFPNLAPYDEHSAVVAMTREHFVPMAGFTPALLADALGAAQGYFRHVQRQPRTTYAQTFWNYFPASGGTQIHPHLQLFASDTPGDLAERELAASQRYFAQEGSVYWADLLQAEERAEERFLARGAHSAWLTSFVSESLLSDVLVIFPGVRTMLDLNEAALDEFCRGVSQVLKGLAAQDVYSFNLAFFVGKADRQDFWLHARLAPRVYMAPRLWGPDTSALQFMYGEHFMVRSPEDAAAALRGVIML